MGMDSMFFNKTKNKMISCDRHYNVLNDYTSENKLWDLEDKIKYRECTVLFVCNYLQSLLNWYNGKTDKEQRELGYNPTYTKYIIEDLKEFNDDDLLVFIEDYGNSEFYDDWCELNEEEHNG